MTFIFDRSLAVNRTGAGAYTAELTQDWNIGKVANGGYSLSILARALRMELDYPELLSITGHYLAPVTPGAANITVEALKRGRRMGYARSLLAQNGTARLAVTAVLGSRDEADGLDHRDLTPPDLPDFADCRLLTGVKPFNDNLLVALSPESANWLDGQFRQDCVVEGWMRFADGRHADSASLPLFADGSPPPIFMRLGPAGWVPTLELTLHLHAEPQSTRLKARFTTRVVTAGILEESGTLWDENNRLVARVRQIAALRTPKAP